MTLYELVKTYGSGKGEDMMWKTLSAVSGAIEHSMPEQEKNDLLRNVYGEISGGHYNEDMAKEDIEKMYYQDRSGEKHYAPYWPSGMVREIYDSVKNEIKPYNACDFNVTMNMIASDYWPLWDKWFPGMREDDRNQKTVEAAVAWLRDPDAKHPDTKIWHYLKK